MNVQRHLCLLLFAGLNVVGTMTCACGKAPLYCHILLSRSLITWSFNLNTILVTPDLLHKAGVYSFVCLFGHGASVGQNGEFFKSRSILDVPFSVTF